jgi:hypothetical protein
MVVYFVVIDQVLASAGLWVSVLYSVKYSRPVLVLSWWYNVDEYGLSARFNLAHGFRHQVLRGVVYEAPPWAG